MGFSFTNNITHNREEPKEFFQNRKEEYIYKLDRFNHDVLKLWLENEINNIKTVINNPDADFHTFVKNVNQYLDKDHKLYYLNSRNEQLYLQQGEVIDGFIDLLKFIEAEIKKRKIDFSVEVSTLVLDNSSEVEDKDIKSDGKINYKVNDETFILHTKNGWQKLFQSILIVFVENIEIFHKKNIEVNELVNKYFKYQNKTDEPKFNLSENYSRIKSNSFNKGDFYETTQKTICNFFKNTSKFKDVKKFKTLSACEIEDKYCKQEYFENKKVPYNKQLNNKIITGK